MTQSPIRSRAQHDMLTRVVADAAYAAERGISQVSARALLDDHEKAGSPQLPARAPKPVTFGGRRAGKTYKLLGAR